MKTHTIIAGIIAIALLISTAAMSQPTKKQMENTITDKGYWVVETNPEKPKESTVRYYNNEHKLVHTETISDRRVRPQSLRERTLLREKTDMAVRLYDQVAATKAASAGGSTQAW